MRCSIILLLLIGTSFCFQLPTTYNYTYDYLKIPSSCWSQPSVELKYNLVTWYVSPVGISDNGSTSNPSIMANFSTIYITPPSANIATPNLSISTTYTHPSNKPSNLTLVWQTLSCYQDKANVSTSCGGLDTGNYSINLINTTLGYASDAGCYQNYGYIYMNYSKAINATNNSLWQVNHGNLSTYNTTIPSDCWEVGTILQLRLGSFYADADPLYNDSSRGECYNGSSWNVITNTSTNTGAPISSGGGSAANVYDGNYTTNVSCTNGGWGACTGLNCIYSSLYEEAVWWNDTSAVGWTLQEDSNLSIVSSTTIINSSNLSDGNSLSCAYADNTSFSTSGLSEDFLVNYTKPSGTSSNSIIKVMSRIGQGGTSGSQQLRISCYNGTAWQTIGQTIRNDSYYYQLCENAILWDITSNISITNTTNTANSTLITSSITNFSLGQVVSFYIQAFDGNYTTFTFSNNTVIINDNFGGGGGGIIVGPHTEPTSLPRTELTPYQSPFGEIVRQIGIVGGGGTVPNEPILADSLVRDNPDFLGIAALTNIDKDSQLNVVLAEYQGLQSLYLKLPFFDMINFGYITILVFGYAVLASSKNLGRRGVGPEIIFGATLIMFGVSVLTMLLNEGLLLFAVKAFGG